MGAQAVKRTPCPAELVIRSRRDRLSSAEQSQLDDHLSVCASCRLEYHVGVDFDAIGGLRAGDDALVAHMAERIVRRQKGAQSTRARFGPLWMAAAAGCVSFAAAVASGAFFGYRPAFLQAPTPASTPTAMPTPPAARARGAMAASTASELPNEPPSRIAPAPPPDPAASHRSTSARSVRAPAVAPPAESASVLFAEANSERRANHGAAAISLYEELQRRHPDTEEALVSHISLGRMFVERGMWLEGLSQLNDYLVASPAGMLAPEALFGKARALDALGRHDEERLEWNRLLARFPSSVYAPQAQRRIAELH
jgi:hypothetical protein